MKLVAVVTGAARGIGFEITCTLLLNNYQVIMIDIDARLLSSASPAFTADDVLPVVCDVGNEAEVQQCLLNGVNHFGRIDLIVNNAV